MAVLFGIFYFTESKFEKDLKADWKPILKKVQRKSTDKIYEEATKHNPKGDLLPDEIDDKVKGKTKKIIEKF